MQEIKKKSASYPDVKLRVIPGHFVTPNSHVNYYLDMTYSKSRLSEAKAIARAMSEQYMASTIVDTILCLDGCEIIGVFLAEDLTKAGVMSVNSHKTIYITEPEMAGNGQFMFRENVQPMITGKNVVILLASATTGLTLAKAVEVIEYYHGNVSGISAIFSAANKVYDIPIHALFTTADLPDYKTYTPHNCQLCQGGQPIDAMANGYGYSKL